MSKYNTDTVSTAGSVRFSYKGLPALFFVTLHSLGVPVEFTGEKIRPYVVNISESEFMSCISMASEL